MGRCNHHGNSSVIKCKFGLPFTNYIANSANERLS